VFELLVTDLLALHDLMKTQAAERIANRFSGTIESGWIRGEILIGEIEITHAVDGNNMDVTMRNLEAGYHQPHPHRLETLLERLSHSMADCHHVPSQVRLEINPVVHFFPRHHERVPRFQWVNRQEPNGKVVAPYKPAGNLAIYDAGEQRRHS